MQRKNRNPSCTRSALNTGVDLNRNFPVCFERDEIGSNSNPCAEDYGGRAPLSEPETKALDAFVQAHTFGVALNFHTFGRILNLPYMCKEAARGRPAGRGDGLDALKPSALLANEAVGRARWFESFARDAFAEMRKISGYRPWTSGHPWEDGLYTVNGALSDWMYRDHGIMAMAPEVGPDCQASLPECEEWVNDRDGFWPARRSILPLAAETLPLSFAATWRAGAVPSVGFAGNLDRAGIGGRGAHGESESVAGGNGGVLWTWLGDAGVESDARRLGCRSRVRLSFRIVNLGLRTLWGTKTAGLGSGNRALIPREDRTDMESSVFGRAGFEGLALWSVALDIDPKMDPAAASPSGLLTSQPEALPIGGRQTRGCNGPAVLPGTTEVRRFESAEVDVIVPVYCGAAHADGFASIGSSSEPSQGAGLQNADHNPKSGVARDEVQILLAASGGSACHVFSIVVDPRMASSGRVPVTRVLRTIAGCTPVAVGVSTPPSELASDPPEPYGESSGLADGAESARPTNSYCTDAELQRKRYAQNDLRSTRVDTPFGIDLLGIIRAVFLVAILAGCMTSVCRCGLYLRRRVGQGYSIADRESDDESLSERRSSRSGQEEIMEGLEMSLSASNFDDSSTSAEQLQHRVDTAGVLHEIGVRAEMSDSDFAAHFGQRMPSAPTRVPRAPHEGRGVPIAQSATAIDVTTSAVTAAKAANPHGCEGLRTLAEVIDQVDGSEQGT
jgi:hypothetical protein